MKTIITEELLAKRQKRCEILTHRTIDKYESEDFFNSDFEDYRISYGTKVSLPKPAYYIAITPAFCNRTKFINHYDKQDEYLTNLIYLEEICADNDISDVAATIMAIMRNKQSIELFSEQKALMELGLKHVHLDNFYQETIRARVSEYEQKRTFLGKPFDLPMLEGKLH